MKTFKELFHTMHISGQSEAILVADFASDIVSDPRETQPEELLDASMDEIIGWAQFLKRRGQPEGLTLYNYNARKTGEHTVTPAVMYDKSLDDRPYTAGYVVDQKPFETWGGADAFHTCEENARDFAIGYVEQLDPADPETLLGFTV